MRPYSFHGLTAMRRAVKQLAINDETEIGRALMAWRRDLIRDLGGPEVVTTQQLSLIEVAARSKLLLDSVDAWLLRQPSLVSYRHKTLFPVVVQRQSIANGFAHYLSLLGLERKTIPPKSLDSYLSERYGDQMKTETKAGKAGTTPTPEADETSSTPEDGETP